MYYQQLNSFSMPANFRGRSGWYVQLWWIIHALFFKPTPQFMYGWRIFLLRLFGAKIGENVKIRSSVSITYPWKLEVGNFCWIGDDCVLYNLGDIKIGNNVAIAHKVYINTGGHDYQKSTFDIFTLPVSIEDECWITNDVYIAPGVIIGRGAIVGARSSVFKNLPSGMVCIGSPAKPFKQRL